MSALKPLLTEQRDAAHPDKSAWVSASAGTGKTQVLTARVLRLLLAGAAPDRLLALTFTKAAAAEMQTRIFDTLACWVRMSDKVLGVELRAIGADDEVDTLRKARTLFADALEAKGGLKVQTLHSFASTLLAAFPLEAGIAPGYETLDERSALQMRADVLANKVARAAGSDPVFMADLAALSIKSGEGGVRDVIAKLLSNRGAFDRSYGTALNWEAAVRGVLGLPRKGSRTETLAAALADDVFDWATVRDYAAAMAAWGTKTGLRFADTLTALLAATPDVRAVRVADLLETGLTKAGLPRKAPNKLDDLHERYCTRLVALGELADGLELAEVAALHLRVGQAIAGVYAAAKQHAGALDYDDLIGKAAELLRSLAAPFVLYKLDQRIEHILVDEGQDTNASQWAIVDAIADEFFAGVGARDEAEVGPRTQFAVGDYKQAIFSFQGTNPDEFDRARHRAKARAEQAGKPFAEIDLNLSFRSTPAVLDVVDKMVVNVGAAAFGLDGDISPHRANRKDEAGEVVLWPPVMNAVTGEDDTDEADDTWVEDSELTLARKIAEEISNWLKNKEILSSQGRPVEAGDVLILVRSRGELVPALVAALHKAKVPVAGADRLRLTAPIAVQDLLALARFALQPGDDLSCAALLVSPFIGWTQEQLLDLAYGRQTTLWRALRDAKADGDPAIVAAERWLGEVLARADYLAPYEFFESILSGELEGRAKLLARLGEEARDPIEEVLNQALAYEMANTPSLQGFLSWVETDDVEVKRDPEAPLDAVRIMTVHGAKGLQAPIVILADATKAVPKGAKPPLMMDLPGTGPAPIFYGRKELLSGPAKTLFDAAELSDAEETMRLLYVAMTRAEDRLYIGGALGARPSSAKSWHEYAADALWALGAEDIDCPRWGEGVLRHASGTPKPIETEAKQAVIAPVALPSWVHAKPPEEETPPRPLVPSAAAEDDLVTAPPSPAMQDAARRGQVLHMLFERLGPVADDAREDAMRRWLKRNAPEQDADAIVREVLGVMDDPTLADWFTPDSLAEAPLSAIVGKRVISGTVDRLIVGKTLVRALDFKTGLKVPDNSDAVPAYHRRQMAAYRDALAAIFPGYEIETALLYTAGPKLILV